MTTIDSTSTAAANASPHATREITIIPTTAPNTVTTNTADKTTDIKSPTITSAITDTVNPATIHTTASPNIESINASTAKPNKPTTITRTTHAANTTQTAFSAVLTTTDATNIPASSTDQKTITTEIPVTNNNTDNATADTTTITPGTTTDLTTTSLQPPTITIPVTNTTDTTTVETITITNAITNTVNPATIHTTNTTSTNDTPYSNDMTITTSKSPDATSTISTIIDATTTDITVITDTPTDNIPADTTFTLGTSTDLTTTSLQPPTITIPVTNTTNTTTVETTPNISATTIQTTATTTTDTNTSPIITDTPKTYTTHAAFPSLDTTDTNISTKYATTPATRTTQNRTTTTMTAVPITDTTQTSLKTTAVITRVSETTDITDSHFISSATPTTTSLTEHQTTNTTIPVTNSTDTTTTTAIITNPISNTAEPATIDIKLTTASPNIESINATKPNKPTTITRTTDATNTTAFSTVLTIKDATDTTHITASSDTSPVSMNPISDPTTTDTIITTATFTETILSNKTADITPDFQITRIAIPITNTTNTTLTNGTPYSNDMTITTSKSPDATIIDASTTDTTVLTDIPTNNIPADTTITPGTTTDLTMTSLQPPTITIQVTNTTDTTQNIGSTITPTAVKTNKATEITTSTAFQPVSKLITETITADEATAITITGVQITNVTIPVSNTTDNIQSTTETNNTPMITDTPTTYTTHTPFPSPVPQNTSISPKYAPTPPATQNITTITITATTTTKTTALTAVPITDTTQTRLKSIATTVSETTDITDHQTTTNTIPVNKSADTTTTTIAATGIQSTSANPTDTAFPIVPKITSVTTTDTKTPTIISITPPVTPTTMTSADTIISTTPTDTTVHNDTPSTDPITIQTTAPTSAVMSVGVTSTIDTGQQNTTFATTDIMGPRTTPTATTGDINISATTTARLQTTSTASSTAKPVQTGTPSTTTTSTAKANRITTNTTTDAPHTTVSTISAATVTDPTTAVLINTNTTTTITTTGNLSAQATTTTHDASTAFLTTSVTTPATRTNTITTDIVKTSTITTAANTATRRTDGTTAVIVPTTTSVIITSTTKHTTFITTPRIASTSEDNKSTTTITTTTSSTNNNITTNRIFTTLGHAATPNTPTVSTANTTQGTSVIDLSMKINREFDMALVDKSSAAFIDLKAKLEDSIDLSYRSLPAYQAKSANVNDFRPGSVIADFSIKTTSSDLNLLSVNQQLASNLRSQGFNISDDAFSRSVPNGLYTSKEQIYPGQDLILFCNTTTNNTIKWRRNGIELGKSERYFIDRNILTVKNVTPGDSGRYECSTTDNSIPFIIWQTILIPEPNIQVSNEKFVKCQNSTLVLQCCVQESYQVKWDIDQAACSQSPTVPPKGCIICGYTINTQDCLKNEKITITCQLTKSDYNARSVTINIVNGRFSCFDGIFGPGNVNDVHVGDCNGETVGYQEAKCNSSGLWQITANKCALRVIQNLKDRAALLTSIELVQFVSNLSIATETNALNITSSPSTILTITDILKTVAEVSQTVLVTKPIMTGFLQTLDVIGSAAARGTWTDLNTNTATSNTSSEILRSIESIGRRLPNEIIAITTNSSHLKKTNDTFPFSEAFGSNLTTQIDIPMLSDKPFITVIVFTSLDNILPVRLADTESRNDTIINGDVAVIQPTSVITNVSLSFAVKNKTLGNPRCVFWNFDPLNGTGGWDSTGCRLKPSDGRERFTCQCNHTTSFSILMSPFTPNPEVAAVLDYVTYIGVGVSMSSLVLCLVVEIIVWKLVTRNDTSHMRHVSIVNIAVSLLTADVCFVVGAAITSEGDKTPLGPCSTATFFMHFFYLALFFWMLFSALLLLYRTIMVFSRMTRGAMMAVAFAVGYGAPLIIAVVTVASTAGRHGYIQNDYKCWLNWKETKALLAFVVPALCIVAINLLVLIVVLCMMLRRGVNASTQPEEKHPLMVIARCVAILTPLFGLTWGFGIGTMVSPDPRIHIVFAFLNSLQGFFILLFGTLLDSKVRSAVARRLSLKNVSSSQCRSTSAEASCSSRFAFITRLWRRDVYHVSEGGILPSSSSNSYRVI